MRVVKYVEGYSSNIHQDWAGKAQRSEDESGATAARLAWFGDFILVF